MNYEYQPFWWKRPVASSILTRTPSKFEGYNSQVTDVWDTGNQTQLRRTFQVRQNRGCLKENFVYASFGSVGLCSTIQFRGINSDYYGS